MDVAADGPALGWGEGLEGHGQSLAFAPHHAPPGPDHAAEGQGEAQVEPLGGDLLGAAQEAARLREREQRAGPAPASEAAVGGKPVFKSETVNRDFAIKIFSLTI